MKKVPVLFLVFNRLESTVKVFSKIKLYQPDKLFIASDGPREVKIGEKNICEEVRNYIINQIDWECDVKTLFRETNLGCGKAVSSAIDWFFNHVESGIILEDDCIPDISFFDYCANLLEKYKNDNKIMHIGGVNFIEKFINPSKSYYFSNIVEIWGWATWKRAWKSYNYKIENFESLDEKLADRFKKNNEYQFWRKNLVLALNNEIDTWDFQWVIAIYLNEGICINPSVNLIQNIGFNELATHTTVIEDFAKGMVAKEMKKVTHPKINYKINSLWDTYTFNVMNKIKIEKKSELISLNQIIRNLFLIFKKYFYFLKFEEKNNIVHHETTVYQKSKNEYWDGNYNSWDIAAKKCNGYDSDEIIERCFNSLLKVKNGNAIYERDSVLFDKKEFSTGLLASLFITGLTNDNQISVLDFGGSFGTSFFQNIEFSTYFKKFEWSIVEQNKMFTLGKEFFENEKLIFFDTIDEVFRQRKPNLFLISSSLQYISNPTDILNQINLSKTRFVVFDRIPFSESENFITIQTVPPSIYDASYPCWIFNYEWLLGQLTNYKVIFDFPSYCDADQFINDGLLVQWKGVTLELIY
jgi:putative methyltransferase (TIGR04325 family)